MASRLIDALFRTDPTGGFVDYVSTVKPYHTKILEVLIEYVWTEEINATVCERWAWDMVFSRPQPDVVYDCGFGIIWDAPAGFAHTAFMIKGVVTGAGSWTVAGDRTLSFTPGTLFVVGRNVGGGSGWYRVASSLFNGTNTVITIDTTASTPPLFWLTSIISTATPHGIAYVFDLTKDFILNSSADSNAFLVSGEKTEKYFEGVFISVDNTYLGRNNGGYIIHETYDELAIIEVTTGLGGAWTVPGYMTVGFQVGSTFTVTGNTGTGNGVYTVVSAVVVDGDTVITVAGTIPVDATATGTIELGNTIVFVKEAVPATKPLANTYDGRMYLHVEGYDEPPYCRLLQAGDLHTDTFVAESIRFDFTLGDFADDISAAVLENEPHGFGTMGYGDGPFGTGDSPFPATAPTTGILILPSGLDALYMDIGGMDEDLSTLVHVYGRTI